VLRDLNVALHVQPMLPLRATARVRRFEVLLRSFDESGDSKAAPVALLERADEKGLGTVLDRRVILQLVESLAGADLAQGGPSLFGEPVGDRAAGRAFPEFVESTLGRAGPPPAPGVRDPGGCACRPRSSATRVAQALQAIGCGLVIDDFDGRWPADLLRLPGVRMVSSTQADRADAVLAGDGGSLHADRLCGFIGREAVESARCDHCRSLGLDFVRASLSRTGANRDDRSAG
jgi:hypothetical protein